MEKFSTHTKLTKVVFVLTLIASSFAIPVVGFSLRQAHQLNVSSPWVPLTSCLVMSAFGFICGIALLKKYLWSLSGLLFFYLVQIPAVRTNSFSFQLHPGFQMYMNVTFGEYLIGVNAFAVVVFLLVLKAKKQVAGERA